MPARNSKTANPYLASSTLKESQCRRMIVSYVAAATAQDAANRVKVEHKTALTFFEHLDKRLFACRVFHTPVSLLLNSVFVGTNLMSELEFAAMDMISESKGISDERDYLMSTRYCWLLSHQLTQAEAPETEDPKAQKRDLDRKLRSIAADISEVVGLTGPVNREPQIDALEAATQKYLLKTVRRIENKFRVKVPDTMVDRYLNFHRDRHEVFERFSLPGPTIDKTGKMKRTYVYDSPLDK